jgi:hypothetical protein
VPLSRQKNAEMLRAVGATLVEHGEDFQAATEDTAALGRRTLPCGRSSEG